MPAITVKNSNIDILSVWKLELTELFSKAWGLEHNLNMCELMAILDCKVNKDAEKKTVKHKTKVLNVNTD